MKQIHAQFATTLPEVSPSSEDLLDIQYMPPGKHQITPFVNGKPKTIDVEVDETVAARLAGWLQQALDAAKANKGDLPWLDFNHVGAEAAGHVQELYWGGVDPVSGGVRAKVRLTGPGKRALAERSYRRFSPAFQLDDDGRIQAGLANMGGLVNEAAFQTIQPIWSRNAGGHEPQPQKKDIMKNKLILVLASAGVSLAADASDDTVSEQVTRLLKERADQVQARDAEVARLKGIVSTLEAENKKHAEAAAKSLVAQAVQAGKLPPQNQDLQNKWVQAILAEPSNKELLENLPSTHPTGQVVTAASASGQAGGQPGEHPFMVEARKVAASRNMALAHAQAALAQENPTLYAQYREGVFKRA